MSTYSKIYIHVVFVVNGRQSLIHPQWEEKLYKYITGIVQNKQQIMVAINGMPDHIHFLIAMKPTCCLSDLVREIKKSTNEMINAESLTSNKFKWQEGYGAFSYTHYSLDTIINYIANQKEHHAKKKFKEEFIDLLKNHQVPYEEKYLFEWIDWLLERVLIVSIRHVNGLIILNPNDFPSHTLTPNPEYRTGF